MLTRSKTRRIQYPVDIDFDESSKQWLANKINLGCGMYEYKVFATNENNNFNDNTITTKCYNLRSRKY